MVLLFCQLRQLSDQDEICVVRKTYASFMYNCFVEDPPIYIQKIEKNDK